MNPCIRIGGGARVLELARTVDSAVLEIGRPKVNILLKENENENNR